MKYKWFTAAFLSLCLIPAAGMLVLPEQQAAGNEHLTPKPSLWNAQTGWNADFLGGLTDYVADHFGFRQELVTANAALQTRLLCTSPAEDVIYGTDGWLYYAKTLDDYQNHATLTESEAQQLAQTVKSMQDYCESRGIGLSLPSLRADNFSMDIMQRVQKVRKSGLTFAPEAGTQRLRDVINKNVTEEDLLRSCAVAFQGGWNSVKLYFMLGLPTETDEDVLGIAELADRVVHCWRENSPNRSHGLRVTVSTSCFVPKPHTPFQWEPQVTREEYMRRVTLLRDNMKARAVTYNWHDADTSLTEAVLSRGDRRLGAMIENIWRQGGFLESWSEGFDLKRWERAAEEEGISFPFYANRERSLDEVLPWDHLYMGVNRRHYIHEYEQAHRGLLSPDCRAQCSGCGAAAFLKGGRCDG